MEWTFDGGGAIYAQIVAKLRLAIASGRLGPGERLLSVRELAVEAGVNPNTMQRALSELERQGLVYSQRTAGRFVTDDGQAIEAARRQIAQEKTESFISAMGELGYDRAELVALLENHIDGKEEE